MASTVRHSFDYVVVDTGSAGCTLASRLPAGPAVSICLVEAGSSDHAPLPAAYIRTPAGIICPIANSKWNWMHRFAAQPSTVDQPAACPRGKVWGGSGAINGMVYTHGDRHGYDRQVSPGNRGRDYDELLPYFHRSEHSESGELSWHGRDDELNVAVQRGPDPINQASFQATEEMSWPYNADFNGEHQKSIGPLHATRINGECCSAAHAFLHPILTRPNPTVSSSALILCVPLESTCTTGAEISQAGEVVQLQTCREVILSTGSISSPQLLLLSDIGPTVELARHGIAQCHELPGAGGNLQDHQDIVLMYRTEAKLGYGLGLSLKGQLPSLRSSWQYLFGRRGVPTSNTIEFGDFFRLGLQAETPELDLIAAPALKNQPQRLVPFGHRVNLHVAVMYPQSRGRVRLNSSDPHDRPLIGADFLSHPINFDTLVQGSQLARKLTASRSSACYLKGELVPGPQVSSRGQIEAWTRTNLSIVFYPVGTYKMSHDQLAVVGDQLRMYGLQGLWAADVSIMPTLIIGNTNTPAIMTGEKTANLTFGKPAPHVSTEQRRDVPELVEA